MTARIMTRLRGPLLVFALPLLVAFGFGTSSVPDPARHVCAALALLIGALVCSTLPTPEPTK